jgi:excisionase family DNA binding protein
MSHFADSCGSSPTETAGGLLRPTEVAHRLKVSRTWVYDAAKSGRLPCLRLGGAEGPLRFDHSEIERFLNNSRLRVNGSGPDRPRW